MTDLIHRILPGVQKPARYTGGEYGQILKDRKDVEVRIAFCFPDTYEIGMSNIGLRILYGVFNSMEGVTVVGQMSDFVYHSGNFYDTNYHLRTEQTHYNTQKWMEALTEQMVQDGLLSR